MCGTCPGPHSSGLDHRTLTQSCGRFPSQQPRARGARSPGLDTSCLKLVSGFWPQPLPRVTCWAHAPLTRQTLQPRTRARHPAGLQAGRPACGNREAGLPQPRGHYSTGSHFHVGTGAHSFQSFPLILQMKVVIRLLFCEISIFRREALIFK